MNKNNLKSYAPQARKDFIAAVTARAQQLGMTATHTQPVSVSGDVALIDGVEWPAKVAHQREALLKRIQRHGFGQTMEEVAYTWFNRFAALRYMELHDFLDHGHRALSSRDGGLPELLRHAAEVSLPGLNAAKVQEMQLVGNRDDELYKQLLVAQCNELSRSMPFLFERIDDDTELLLPDNLLRTDSIVAKLVAGVPEEDWQEIEVIGWLYQFYISEKKDQVIGKVVKSEDIPAATQLFTPNWIVQYLVQNSVGRLWLMANPTSQLASEWPYYIQPAEQTPEVQAQLDALIHTRIAEDGDTLNPETITVLDPACGSGHILVVAYDVLKAIYLERGYRLRDIPRLILEKNLYGLDIDDRAAQMAGFALLMKARADDRRLLNDSENPPRLNVLSLQESKGLNYEELSTHLAPFGVQRATLWGLIEAFEHAKTFGSLIQIPYQLKTHLEPLAQVLALAEAGGDMYGKQAAQDLQPFVRQAQLLAMQFDAVVANPPYMGSNYINSDFKSFLKVNYKKGEKDLFAASVIRCGNFQKKNGYMGIVCPFNWMYTSSFVGLRELLISNGAIDSLVKPSYTSFFDSAIVSLCAYVYKNSINDFNGKYFDLGYLGSADVQPEKFLSAISNADSDMLYVRRWSTFKTLPGSPIAYSASEKIKYLFEGLPNLGSVCKPCEGLKTGDNDRFLRFWWEVDYGTIERNSGSFNEFMHSGRRWLPHQKGGDYQRWFGNDEYVIDWRENGVSIKSHPKSTISNLAYQLREGATWSYISSSYFGVRYSPSGFTFNNKGPMVFGEDPICLTAYLCSTLGSYLMKTINPTLNFSVGNVSSLPYPANVINKVGHDIRDNAKKCISIAMENWKTKETSFDYDGIALALNPEKCNLARDSELVINYQQAEKNDLLRFEEENNKFFIDGCGLSNEMPSSHPIDQLTYRVLDRSTISQNLLSYAIGCMMGRYSLDEPGLIYAHAGNVGFDPSRYARFPADADGILPVTDEHWFEDDAPARVREFLQAVWGPDNLAENLAWLAESLGQKGSETPEETIRRYIADKFYKDHLQTYKKRPIYWLFSSGKQGAFQALVYLHRYHEGTLARMRAEYVIPLSAKMAARLEMLEQDANAATSAAARTKVRKQIESLRKKQTELLSFDEKLRHCADMRITLDLDDGVKVNYGKFGDLLEGVKVVTGGAGDE